MDEVEKFFFASFQILGSLGCRYKFRVSLLLQRKSRPNSGDRAFLLICCSFHITTKARVLHLRFKSCLKLILAQVNLFSLQDANYFKGTVQRELRWVKIGINRTAMKIWIAGKCRLTCPKGHHHERSINILGGCSTF